VVDLRASVSTFELDVEVILVVRVGTDIGCVASVMLPEVETFESRGVTAGILECSTMFPSLSKTSNLMLKPFIASLRANFRDVKNCKTAVEPKRKLTRVLFLKLLIWCILFGRNFIEKMLKFL